LAATENNSLTMGRPAQHFLRFIVVAISLLACSDSIKRHKYEALIEHNQDLFDQANSILDSKADGVRYIKGMKRADTFFSATEIAILSKVIDKTGALFIEKSRYYVYYSMDGLMDSDYGLWYSKDGRRLSSRTAIMINDHWQYY
jgi:hypothetical protein